MSPTISRILLTIVLFPLAAFVNLIAYILLDEHLDDEAEVLIPALITAFFMQGFWLLLWRKTVRFTSARLRQTIIAGVATALAAAGVGVTIGLTVEYSADDIAIYIACNLWALLWITATLFIWRETKTERTDRLERVGASTIVCPACQYNLTGLREARCPECGTGYTLNELLAGQPSRRAAEIEAG